MHDRAASRNSQLHHPRYWPSWLAVVLLRLLAYLPAALLIRLGPPLGRLLFLTLGRRRRIARQNLQLCFAEQNSAAIDALLKRHFQALGTMVMEMLIIWWKPPASIPAKVEITGLEHLHDAAKKGHGVLLLSAHMTSLEMGGGLLQWNTGLTIHGMYRPHENPVFDAVVLKRRQARFAKMIARDNVKDMLRSLKQGTIVWYAPDQAYRGRNSVLAPFFGQQVTTNPGTSRIAKLSGAPVVPYFPLRTAAGLNYELRILPALEALPSGDLTRDATLINQLIEEQVRQYPEQYYWVHRRFKPPHGAAPVG